jgi:hypothetical protein
MQIQRSLKHFCPSTSVPLRARFAKLAVLGSTLLLAAILAAFVLYPAGHVSQTQTNFFHTSGQTHAIGQQIAGSGPGDSPPATPTPTPTPTP